MILRSMQHLTIFENNPQRNKARIITNLTKWHAFLCILLEVALTPYSWPHMDTMVSFCQSLKKGCNFFTILEICFHFPYPLLPLLRAFNQWSPSSRVVVVASTSRSGQDLKYVHSIQWLHLRIRFQSSAKGQWWRGWFLISSSCLSYFWTMLVLMLEKCSWGLVQSVPACIFFWPDHPLPCIMGTSSW
jgi:hypothetical protein